MSRTPKMPPKEWDTEKFLLRGKTKWDGKCRQHDRNVHVALMVYKEHIGDITLEGRGSGDSQANAADRENNACPDPRTRVLDPPGRVDKGTRQRDRSHRSCCEENERRCETDGTQVTEPLTKSRHDFRTPVESGPRQSGTAIRRPEQYPAVGHALGPARLHHWEILPHTSRATAPAIPRETWNDFPGPS